MSASALHLYPLYVHLVLTVPLFAVAIKLECIKTKHPQLHIESKFYRIMQVPYLNVVLFVLKQKSY